MRHGADLLSYGKGAKLIDFSSNINPLGPPPGTFEAIRRSVEDICAYPDIEYRLLRHILSSYLGVGPENIAVGNGSMELIDAIIKIHRRVVIYEPCFGEYELRARANGVTVTSLPLGADLRPDPELLRDSDLEGALVILGNPNNPTGILLDECELKAFRMKVKSMGGNLLFDEAFFEFTGADTSALKLFAGEDDVFVIRAATKFFGCPGIRLGYGVMSEKNARAIGEKICSWSVNSLACAAAKVMFKDAEYARETVRYVKEARDSFYSGLKGLSFLKPYESSCNFILAKLSGLSEEEVLMRMVDKGFLVRTCSSFNGLDGEHIRLAVRTKEQNEAILKALKELER